MTKSQKLLLRQSEIREKLNGLLAKETRTAAEETELRALTTEGTAIEPEIRAAMVADQAAVDDAAREAGQPTNAETRERLELRGRANVGAFLAAALSGRLPDGAEAEYAAACHVPGGHIPLDAFEQDRPPETRAVTPSPGSGEGLTVAPVQPFLFAQSIATMLGIEMPSVPSGGYSEMTITTGLTVNPEAKGDAADGTAAALTAVTANPRRISARLSLAVEDVAMVGTASFNFPVECRASASGPVAPGACCWPGDGISVNLAHHSAPETRAVPVREGNEIRIEAPATPAIFSAVQAGQRFMSVEFHAVAETRTTAGIREIERAVLTGACLTDDPEYHQTSAEVRTRKGPRLWL